MMPTPCEERVAVHRRTHRSDVLTLLYGVGLALTSATQLRLPSLPIGPGEVLLVVWLMCAVFAGLVRGTLNVNAVSRAFLLFWMTALSLLSLGTLVAIVIDRFQPASLYDFVAFLLSALTSVMFVLQPELRRRSIAVIDTLLVGIGGSQFLLAALLLVGVRYVGPIDSFYEGARFQGWSNNPNQLAFVLLALPLFALYRLGRQRRTGRRIWFAFLAACPILPGALCFSNALFFAWTAGLSILAGVAWVRSARNTDAGYLRRASRLILVPLVALSVAGLLGPTAVELASTGLSRGYNYGDHGADRVNRWKFGLQAALNSPLVGLGPGSFSGPYQPFGGGEAHNTLIDWGSSTGLLGDLALLGLLAFAAWTSLRGGSAVGVGIVTAMLIFSSFHYILRQPVFWFDVLAIAALGLVDPQVAAPSSAKQASPSSMSSRK